MTEIARNGHCPCGSGKKAKRCCHQDAPGIAQRTAAPRTPRVVPPDAWLRRMYAAYHEEDEFTNLSNSVIDLVAERRFEEALAVCGRLLSEYSDVADGLDRSAIVHAARGEHALAADFYRRTYAFVTDPVRAAHYDGVEHFRQEAERHEALAAAARAR